jgi:hypothetical protein
MSDTDRIVDSIQAMHASMIEGFRVLSEGIHGTNGRIDQTNERIDQTNQRLDETILELRTFKRETGERLDGIGNYLRSINGTLLDHSVRIHNLELRVSKLEDKEGAA